MQSVAPEAVHAPGGRGQDGSSAAFGSAFIELFFPVHYQIGMAVEASMCGQRLSRSQGAALLLIDAEANAQGRVAQKIITRLLHEQQQLGTSAVSKILRDLARAPLQLIEQKESAHSGREKVIALTAKGAAVVASMKQDGRAYLAELFAHVPDATLASGLRFLRDFFSRTPRPAAAPAGTPAPRLGVSAAVSDNRLHHPLRRRRNDKLTARIAQRAAREE